MTNHPRDSSPGCLRSGPTDARSRECRPAIDREKCNACLNCVVFCPDDCWSLDENGEAVVWNGASCNGCSICVNECTTGALAKAYEFELEDGAIAPAEGC